jgi:dipeptide/tripeptide permease
MSLTDDNVEIDAAYSSKTSADLGASGTIQKLNVSATLKQLNLSSRQGNSVVITSRSIKLQSHGVELPTDVHKKEQLVYLPEKYLSGDPKRPLLVTDEVTGTQYKYALHPMFYSVVTILIIECLERLTYYGVQTTQTAFLLGTYNSEWNPGMTSVEATSYTSTSIALAYTSPFIGGIVADGFLGDFWSILVGVSCFYLPGLILISLTTFPYLLGETFPIGVLTAGMLALMPLGTGFIKSVVNVFGAKQYHPLLQAALVESYYVNFYVSINVGALVGGILIPILCQINMEAAYLVPVCSLGVGLIIFLAFSGRFVKRAPEKTALFNTIKLLGKGILCKPFDKSKESNGGSMSDGFVDGVKRLIQVIPVACLVLPFNIVYAQITTVFILQGGAMRKMGLLDASLMSNFDPISVLITGLLVGSFLYPSLTERGIRFPLTYKFAVGSFFGACAIISALLVNMAIRKAYLKDGSAVAIIWQCFNYAFVGIGEVFAMSTSYEAAYIIAPTEQKALSSAFQLFLTGGLSNYICIGLYNGCSAWFPIDSSLEAYATSKLDNYLWVLFGIAIFGIFLNIAPPVKNWVERLVFEALEATAIKEIADDSFSASFKKESEEVDETQKVEGVGPSKEEAPPLMPTTY